MEPAPPPLTSETVDDLFALLADVGAVGLRKVRERLEAAETDESVERMVRSLQTVGRYVRQTIALKQRFDREQISLAAERRREAEVETQETRSVRDAAVASRRKKVCRHFEYFLWNEYERDEAEELYEDVGRRLDELADDPEFLDTPADTLILRLANEMGLLDDDEEAEGGEGQDDTTEAQTTEAGAKPPARTVTPADAAPQAAPPSRLPPPDPPPDPDVGPRDRGVQHRRDQGWMG